MKALCHQLLANYLTQKYLDGAPKRYTWAFRLGCIQPDKNPATYFKGSLRCQMLRGHNWDNAQRYIQRTAFRLEKRRKLRLLDFYSMGKLIHYTTDAFTYAHNAEFPDNLRSHCNYERDLKKYFPRYLARHREDGRLRSATVMGAIRAYHREYICNPTGIYTDSRYSVTVCSAVLALLLKARPIPGL